MYLSSDLTRKDQEVKDVMFESCCSLIFSCGGERILYEKELKWLLGGKSERTE